MILTHIVRILWARRWIVVAGTVPCLLGAAAAVWVIPPRYQANADVLLDASIPNPITGQAIAAKALPAYIGTQAELVRDYRVTGAVVDALQWTSSPQLLDQYNARPAGDDRDFRRWLSAFVSSGTGLSLVPDTSVLRISYTAPSPDAARAIAEAIRTAYIEQSLAANQELMARNADFQDAQLAETRRRLVAVEARKTAIERRTGIVLQDEGPDVQSNLLAALVRRGPEGTRRIPVEPRRGATATTQLAQMDARISSLTTVLGANHPTLIAMRQQRGVMAGAASREQVFVPAVALAPVALAGQVAAQTGRVIAQRGTIEQLRLLQAEIDLLRARYLATAARAKSLRQDAQSNDVGISADGDVLPPTDPVYPNVPLIGFGALGLGLGTGVLLALIVELLGRRVRDAGDLAGTGTPVITVLKGAYVPPRAPRWRRVLAWARRRMRMRRAAAV